MMCEDFLAGLTGVNPLTATAGYRAAIFRHMRTCAACGRVMERAKDMPVDEDAAAILAAAADQIRQVADRDYADEEFLRTVLGDDYDPG